MKKLLLFLLLCLYSVFILSQESYYDNVNLNLTGISLKEALAAKIIITHTNNLSYTPGIWNASMATDMNPLNNNEVLLVYGYENGSDSDSTNDRERDINDNCTSSSCSGLWNREHVYPNSLANPDLDQGGINGPPYADAHNLRPCDSQRNSSRGNKKFIDGFGNSGATGTGWYPGDEWKGDVARIIMYMYLRYDERTLPSNVGIGSNSDTPDDMIDLFLQWNADDPVSDIEKQRNPYHENTSNSDAQGNRNPFIDNPRLATRIWDGPEAEDIWGIYTNIDSEAPTVPTNLIATNITTYSIELSWDASSDNVGVTSYEVYVDESLVSSTSNTNYTITGLASNISFNLTVLAKDIADNTSSQSTVLTVSTLEDTVAPTIPSNIVISNETDVSFKVSWDASTDNTAVTEYDLFVDGSLHATTSDITYTVNGLIASTTYSISITAKDEVNNISALSSFVNATTTDGSVISANELLISEYIEGSSNNKAIEIANLTDVTIDLSLYNLRRQGNGDGAWSPRFVLTGILAAGDVVVLVNESAENSSSSSDPNVAIVGSYLIANADIIVPNNSSNNYGEPLNFNGNDPVGLFKDDLLIDIIGIFDGGSGFFAKDVTLRRKSTVSEPNTIYDEANEWDSFPQDTVDDLGIHTTTLSTIPLDFNNLNIYPNPTSFNYIFIKNSETVKVEIFSILGKKIVEKMIKPSNTKLDISYLSKSIYLLKISNNNTTTSRKIIKQ